MEINSSPYHNIHLSFIQFFTQSGEAPGTSPLPRILKNNAGIFRINTIWFQWTPCKKEQVSYVSLRNHKL